jgi:hypothetical protein
MAGAFVVLASFIVLVRTRSYGEPLEEDLITYSVIGHEVLHGKRLYTDVWDAKPPVLYATYAGAEALVGHGAAEVFFLGVVAALITLAGVYLAGAGLGRPAGLWAAAFWAVLGGLLVLQANQPNSEAFVNACCVGGFALLVRHPGGRPAPGRAFLAGVLFVLASLYKPVAVIAAASIAAAHVLAPPGGVSRKSALLESALLGGVGVLGWSLVFVYAAVTHQSSIYWATHVSTNAGRSAGFLFNLYRYLREGNILPRRLWFLGPQMLALTAISLWSLRRGHRRQWILFLGWVAGTHVMIFIQGEAFHPHTYQFWLPLLAVGSGWAVAETEIGAPGSERRRWRVANGAAGIALLVILIHEIPNYRLPPDEWARKKYGEQILEDRRFARSLGAELRPEDTMFQYGDMVSLYYYCSKRPGPPALWSGFLRTRDPLGTRLSEETLLRLKAAPPDLFVIPYPESWEEPSDHPARVGLAGRLFGVDRAAPEEIAWDKHPLYQWAMQHYQPGHPPSFPVQGSSHFLLYVRSGSGLEDRWRRHDGK